MKTDDPFGRLDYRRFVAWKKRVERERPFLLSTFGEPSKKPLVDLGCGTGEHSELLASEGFAVVGLDRSAALLAKAREAYGTPRFVRGLLDELPFRGEGTFAGALCLGNTLVNLPDDHRISACFRSLRRLLPAGAPFLIQIVNYDRILDRGIRHLPLNFREGDDGELLYLRLMDRVDEKRIRFEVLTLARGGDADGTRIVQTTSTILRALRHDELGRLLKEAGFGGVELFGDYAGGRYDRESSSDIIAVAHG